MVKIITIAKKIYNFYALIVILKQKLIVEKINNIQVGHTAASMLVSKTSHLGSSPSRPAIF